MAQIQIASTTANGRLVPVSPIDFAEAKKVSFNGSVYSIETAHSPILRSLLFNSTTELNSWTHEKAGAHSITLDTAIKREGVSSGRFELNKTDIDVVGSKRVEIVDSSAQSRHRWYSFSTYFPAEYISDSQPEIFAQWHEIPDFHLGEYYRSPPISIGIQNDAFYLDVRWSDDPVNAIGTVESQTFDGTLLESLGSVAKGVWIDWIIEVNFHYTNEGLLKIWKDGALLFERVNLPVMYNDIVYPYFKFGLYKWIWKQNPEASAISQRVLYFDRVLVGNAFANLSDM